MVIMTADNILTPQAIQKVRIKEKDGKIIKTLFQMYKMYEAVNAITVDGKMFSDICTR